MSPGTLSTQRSSNGIFIILCFLYLLNIGLCEVPLDQFYSYNVTGDIAVEKKDDGGAGPIHIQQTNFSFYGKKFNKLFINNNGIVTFGKRNEDYKPLDFPLERNTTLIAPFWADVDTQHSGGDVWYRQTTDHALLKNVTNEVRTYFFVKQEFTWMFIATWLNVGFYGASNNIGKSKRNTFQLVLATNGDESYVIFNYHKLQWTTGSNSEGDTETGLGGFPAQVGFNAGDGVNYLTVEGAQTPAVINLTKTSNVDFPGKWIFGVSSEEIRDVKCSHDVNVKIQPDVASMLGGEEIRVTGPCFTKKYPVLAQIGGTQFECSVINFVSASCTTPPIFRTGEMTFNLNPYGISWNYTTNINIRNIAVMRPYISRSDPDLWEVGKQVTVSYSSLPSTYTTLEVLGYQFVNNTPELTVIQSQSVSLQPANSSKSTLWSQNLVLSQNINNFTAAVVRIGTSRSSNDALHPVSVWSDVFPVRWNTSNSSVCSSWSAADSLLTQLDNKNSSCPCNIKQASRDTGRFEADPLCNINNVKSSTNCAYRPDAAHCVVSKFISGSSVAETCCYDNAGSLIDIRDNKDGGSMTRYHFRYQNNETVPFFTYLEQDVIPYLHCCQYSDMCQSYITARPPATCENYDPPAAAQGAGDPHLTTLDGKSYMFNGLGDFVLVQDAELGIVVQVRAAQAQDTEGKLQNASIFSGVAIAHRDVSDVVEIHKSRDGDSRVFINGNQQVAVSSTSEFKGVVLTRNRTENNTENYVIDLDSASLSLSLDVSHDLINVLVMVGDKRLRGNLQGLLGNFDGNPGNDFIPRNSTALAATASLEDIHYKFGMTWKVDKNSSLFLSDSTQTQSDSGVVAPPGGESFAYRPTFDLGSEKQRNGTEEICGSNLQCQFDYQVTGNAAIAKSTMTFIEKFQEIQNDIKKVARCPFLEAPNNGEKNISGYSPGSVAMFRCLEGFDVLTGSGIRTCGEDGKWTGSVLICAKRIPSTEQDASVNLILYSVGGGIGGAVILVLIVVFIIISCRRNRKKKEDDGIEGNNAIVLPEIFRQDIPQPIFDDQAFLESLQRLNTTNGAFKIPRPSYVDTSIFKEYF